MRDLRELDGFRVKTRQVIEHYGSAGDETCGCFLISVLSYEFVCVASSDGGWDHVSVSHHKRCPSWNEMEAIKRLFFREDETAMQLHVPVKDHISFHPYCLHLWRPQGMAIPLPPSEYVA